MEFDLEVTIARPVADVFAYVTDVRHVPEWQESAVSAEWLEEGRRFRERRHFMGRDADVELEVAELEPERRFDVRAVKAPVKFEIRHSFEAVDGGTRVRVHGEAKLGGALRFAAGMARRQAEHQFRRDFERLKGLLEGRDEESPSDRPPRLADE
ncbi:MAG TPA: SRPBCC family protein [Gaiellaceae bacterium]